MFEVSKPLALIALKRQRQRQRGLRGVFSPLRLASDDDGNPAKISRWLKTNDEWCRFNNAEDAQVSYRAHEIAKPEFFAKFQRIKGFMCLFSVAAGNSLLFRRQRIDVFAFYDIETFEIRDVLNEFIKPLKKVQLAGNGAALTLKREIYCKSNGFQRRRRLKRQNITF